MAFFVPLLGFAGTGILMNYQASQQLEFVGKDGRFARMFWPPFGMGLLLGLWFGVSFGSRISNGLSIFESWFAWLFGIKRIEDKNPKHQ
jgi:hypothetical protein